MTDTLLINCDAVLGAFRQWQAEQEPIEAQLSESLAALAAYQSHLDDWQQQLAREREELRTHREQWEREIGEADQSQIRLNELTGELASARDDIAALTARLQSGEEELLAERERFEHEREAARNADSEKSLFTANELDAARMEIGNLTDALNLRTEELGLVDTRRVEAVAELESARVREQELQAALEELRQSYDLERLQWIEERQQLSESVEDSIENVEAEQIVNSVVQPGPGERRDAPRVERPGDSPVFASVKEQFGKLRQQRAMDRPAPKKAR